VDSVRTTVIPAIGITAGAAAAFPSAALPFLPSLPVSSVPGTAGGDTVPAGSRPPSPGVALPFPAGPAPAFLATPWSPAPVGAPGPLAARADTARAGVLDLGRYGELAVGLRGRATLGGAWRRVEPCSGLVSLRCDAPAVPTLEPDVNVAAVARGTLFGRVRVDVDYDPARGFDATNNLRLSYEGRAGEALRRVDAGVVSLAPPASRFLGAGAPAAGIGVLATGSAGPAEVQALFSRRTASVSRREFRRALGSGGVAEEHRGALDDAGYAAGQFFFLFDPAALRGHPHLDVRALTARDAPAALVPRAGVQLFRYAGTQPAPDGSTVLLRAAPADPARAAEAVAGPFRLLAPGVDYHLHPSGAWLALRTPLGDEEALAVAYVSADGTPVGDPAPGPLGVREARLLRGPRAAHRPGASTWPLEMRHVYLLSTADEVEPASVRIVISRGEPGGGDLSRPHPAGGAAVPYLRLFGLDEAAPADAVDPARLYRPAREEVDPVLRGTWLVFPTLRPFAEPPAVPSARLTAGQAAAALGEAANPALYEAADLRERQAAARFRLTTAYRAGGGGARAQAVFPLGAAMVQEGSERVFLGGRQLRRGVDYEILYDVGEVHLRDPGALAALGPDSELRVTFQERTLFPESPTWAAGLRARVPLGGAGELSLLGVSQRESSPLARPPLGAEPAGLFFGGAALAAAWGAPWLTRMLAALPGARGGERSEVRLSGEVAVSAPTGAGMDAAYLDDFEDAGEIPVPVQRQSWRLGSAPADPPAGGAPGFPAAFDASTAGRLVWQHDVREAGGRATSGVRTAEVDTLLRVTQGGRTSGVLHLSLEPRAPGPAWRSVTAVLSPTGRDLRDHAFLEFYARGGAPGQALVVELGTVSEDALALGEDGSPRGAGVLDREWDPAAEAWTPAHDERGMWGEECRAAPGESYPLGDPLANCARGNGAQDTEDLNGNGVLDTAERVARYVVALGGGSPYLVRDTAETGTSFRLYRVPLRGGAGDDLRAVAHLRLTLAGEGPARLSLARPRLTGSQWQKRSAAGVARGLAGADTAASGRLEVDHVSRLAAGDGYVSPPGIGDRLQDARGGAAALGGAEFNEKSLRLRYAGVGPGDRAEAHLPLPQAPRSFLAYRELRFWALARRGRWGEGGERLVVRAGNGDGDHYLYRVALAPVGAPRSAADWGAEVVVELARWQALRAEAEARLQERAPGARGPLVVWDADSAYAVVLTERGRAPNLAAVREVSLAVWNGGALPADGEVWVDDLRLAGAERRAGAAAHATLSVVGGGLLRGEVSYTRQDGYFRAPGGGPSYRSDAALTLDATLELGALAPRGWGLRAPLRVRHSGAGSEPVFLDGTDLPAAGLQGVRRPGQKSTDVRLEVRRELPGRSGLARALLDPLALRVEYSSAETGTAYQSSRRSALAAWLGYELHPRQRSLALLPGGVLGAAPLRLTWTPATVSLTHELLDARDEQVRYPGPLGSAADTLARPLASRGSRLVQQLLVGFQPFPALSADVALRSTRDLLAPGRDTAAVPAEGGAQAPAARLGAGREAERSVATQLAWTPRPAAWLSGDVQVKGAFDLAEDPEAFPGAAPDSAERLRSFGARRETAARLRVDPGALARLLAPAGDSAGGAGALGWLLGALGPLEVGWGNTLQSRFERVGSAAPLPYQLGWGGAGGFLRAGADSASSASSAGTWSARGRLDLAGTLGVGVAFDERRTEVFGARSGRVERERSWPDVSLEWSAARVPAALGGVLRSASFSAGYRRRELRRDDDAGGVAQGSSGGAAPLRASLVWAGGITTTYQGEWSAQTAAAPAARMESRGADHTLTLGGSVPLPRSLLRGRTLAPLTLSLALRSSERWECRLTPEAPACTGASAFSRTLDRGARFQADTRAAGVTFGLSADYGERRSRTTELTGLRQLQVGLFAEFAWGSGAGGAPATLPQPALPPPPAVPER
jgi:hypothetical protein